MLLTIDIGNSNVVIGCLNKDNETQCLLRMVTDLKKTEDEYAAGMQTILQHNGIDCHGFEGAIICSVVPPLTEIFHIAVEKIIGCDALVVGAGIKTGLNIMIENPATLGSDIVAASVAAMAEFPQPVIVIDMGTATTMSVLDKNGAHIGGCIIPGVRISMDALTDRTALLPGLQLDQPKRAIGRNTIDAMRSGIMMGTACMLDGMVERMEQELGYKTTVVATGGIAKFIVPLCKTPMIYDQDLLIKGLAALYRDNTKKK